MQQKKKHRWYLDVFIFKRVKIDENLSHRKYEVTYFRKRDNPVTKAVDIKNMQWLNYTFDRYIDGADEGSFYHKNQEELQSKVCDSALAVSGKQRLTNRGTTIKTIQRIENSTKRPLEEDNGRSNQRNIKRKLF